MRCTGNRVEVEQAVHELPLVLSGKLPDRGGAAAWLHARVGAAVLEKIGEAYDQKADSGVDAMGVQWPPLKERTVKERKKQGGRLAALRDYQEKRRDLDKSRKSMGLFAYRAKKQKLQDRYREALANVGKAAVSGKFHRILLVTGRMRGSVNPGDPDNILRTGPGYVEIGSGVGYFKYHNSDKPRRKNADGTDRLPRRQVLPDRTFPADWLAAAYRVLREGLRDPVFWSMYLAGKAG